MKNEEVDHIDGDGLNNQRYNLRPATHAQNMRNRNKHRNNTSGYKGVFLRKDCNRWEAYIKVNTKRIYLGLFKTAKSAAQAYDKAAKLYHKEYARLNFPEENQVLIQST